MSARHTRARPPTPSLRLVALLALPRAARANFRCHRVSLVESADGNKEMWKYFKKRGNRTCGDNACGVTPETAYALEVNILERLNAITSTKNASCSDGGYFPQLLKRDDANLTSASVPKSKRRL